MSTDEKTGRTWLDVFFGLTPKTRIVIVGLLPLIVLLYFFLSYWVAKPGDMVSLLGIIEIKKTGAYPKADTQDNSSKIFKKSKPWDEESTNEPKKKYNLSDGKDTLQSRSPKTTVLIKRSGVSVLIAGKGSTINWDLTQKIGSMIRKCGANVVSNPALSGYFFSIGNFDKAFGGDSRKIIELGNENPAAHLILGKQSIEYTNNSEYDGLLTANISVEIRVISSDSGNIKNSFTISGRGAGFTNADAGKVAWEQIVNKFKKKILSEVYLWN